MSSTSGSYWPHIVATDYPYAALRLTTLVHSKVIYLLFGYVELFPEEITPPTNYGAKCNFFNDFTVCTSLTTLPIDDALRWYEDAASGEVALPQVEPRRLVAAVPLGPEAAMGHLIAAREPPIFVPWHNGARMHRLVPMEELQEPVKVFLNQPERSERRGKIQGWLEKNCFIDLSIYPDCAGGVLLLAPNPILRSCNAYPLRVLADGTEMVSIRAIPRSGHILDGLSIRLHEFRLDGRSSIDTITLDSLGTGEILLPQRVNELSLEISCPNRGLLSVTTPHGFFSSVAMNAMIVSAKLDVEVPGRTKGAPTTHNPVLSIQKGFEARVGKEFQGGAAPRLAALLAARAERPVGGDKEVVFSSNRPTAVSFIRGLIWNASRQVLFVDPYFNHIDVREFAMSVGFNRCAIGFLTGRDEPGWQNYALVQEPPQVAGDLMLSDLSHINEIRTKNGFIAIDGRVMGVDARGYHDRFLVVDDDVWHFGHSFNSIGDGVSMATKLTQPQVILSMIQEDFAVAVTFESYWTERQRVRNRAGKRNRLLNFNGFALRLIASLTEGVAALKRILWPFISLLASKLSGNMRQ